MRAKNVDEIDTYINFEELNWAFALLYFLSTQVNFSGTGGVVKVEIYEVDTKIELYVDTFWLGL